MLAMAEHCPSFKPRYVAFKVFLSPFPLKKRGLLKIRALI
jgi:hypothetical protein